MMKVSVIIPIYNVEKYLNSMVECILPQLQQNDELLLVDDGSTDKSGAICDNFAARDERVQVFHIPNGGVSSARNFGLLKASGEYVQFADSDDFIEPNMYARFSEIVDTYHPDIVMCGSLQINTGRGTNTVVAPSMETYLSNRNQITEYLNGISLNDMKCLIHYIWNKWYRRDFLMNNKLMFSSDLNLGEDYVFNCTAAKVMKTLYTVPNTYYHYFIRGNSLVSAFQPEPWKSRQMLFDAHKSLYESYNIWNENKNAIMLEEGKMCFAALRGVNSQRCKLNRKEKTEFLKKMSESKQMKLIIFYLKNSGKKLHKIWLFLICTFGITGIRIMLLADYINKKIGVK